jgi:hypothetical protein
MKRTTQPPAILLRWSDHVPTSDIQDPLGLGLRGSARLASRLLYCITSITPRARYFSFISWCIHDFRRHRTGGAASTGLRDAIVLREQALAVACIAHHGGEPCGGGALVGSRGARKWFLNGHTEANFRTLKPFAKNPALSAYLNSLVNLRFFNMERELPDSDAENEDETFSFDDIELSELGRDLANRYNSAVGTLLAVRQLSTKEKLCKTSSLAELGKRGGLCELSDQGSPDRDLLRDIFFGQVGTKGESHLIRRRSLLLLLDLCHQLGTKDMPLDEESFAAAVYFGECATANARLKVIVPKHLADIATRWRMFYFHHFMAVALEGLFSWLVSHLSPQGLVGSTIDSVVAQLAEPRLRKNLSDVLNVDLPTAFSDLTPSTLLATAGLADAALDSGLGNALDHAVRSQAPLAEDSLEDLIRSNKHLHSSTGLALPLVLIATTLGRYSRWAATNYGQWLASIAADSYLDLVPPLVSAGLARRFGEWWHCPWGTLTPFLLSRYVIHQHLAMSYEKTSTGDRCLLQMDGAKVFSTGSYDAIGITNPRLNSAIQILTDLGLIAEDDHGLTHLTRDGRTFLQRASAKESEYQVS